MNEKLDKTRIIANKIIMLRKSMGFSQSELARRAEITGSAISQIEKGNRMPSLAVISKIADVFRLSVSDIIVESIIYSEKEAQLFFMEFGDIENLSETDQEMIKSIVKRLGVSK